MNNVRQKIANVMAYIFGIGIMIALFVGALSVLGYIAAFIIGGEIATEICTFIYTKIYTVLFYFSSSVVLFGLLKMYVAGEKSMTPSSKATNRKNENAKS